jgi:hypothetical protein
MAAEVIVADATEATTGKSKNKTGKLFALANKFAERKSYSIRRETAEAVIGVKMDGFPTALTPTAVAKLASTNGVKLSIKSTVGEASGNATGTLSGKNASEFIDEMTTE